MREVFLMRGWATQTGPPKQCVWIGWIRIIESIHSYTSSYTRARKWCLSVPIPADGEATDAVRFTYECAHLRKGAYPLKTILEAFAEIRAGVRPLAVARRRVLF